MRMRMIVGVAALLGLVAVSTLGAVPTKRTAAVRFLRPTNVAGTFVIGTVVFEHDDAKMARGEPCTTVYRFKSETEVGKPIVSFMCIPQDRPLATKFEATITSTPSWPDRLIEYQITGEQEGHGVPTK